MSDPGVEPRTMTKMSRIARVLVVWTTAAIALVIAAPARTAEPRVAALLQAADRYRAGSEAMQVETLVSTLAADGSVEKERRYTVLLSPGASAVQRSLVLMRSPAEAGQKVLMLGDDFWLLLPGSSRPLRITPTQKLLGEASTGDIATLAWSQDYEGQLRGAARCDGDRACWHLSLQARRAGLSYPRIELWLGQAHGEPLHAELYVGSGKLAKTARFVLDRQNAPTRVDEMWLGDQLTAKKQTRIRYLSRQRRSVPEAWLNPMFLARNPSLE